MGIVYAAHDERLNRTIAVKVMSPGAADAAIRSRFLREARAAAAVNHPNICQIYEVGGDHDEPYIAMELLEGQPLDQRLRQEPMEVAQVLTIGGEILAALAALHARGIVHRDLKPSNVFLTAEGVKLLDFGLAWRQVGESEEQDAGLTRTGVVVGTPHYLAPERLAGGPADARSDLFAVGAMLFEMLSGQRAFRGRTVAEVVHAVAYEQPPALEGSPAVRALDRVIRRVLAKRPEKRPGSATEMAAELERIRTTHMDSGPALAHPFTRVIALPFQVLRLDAETDFLAYSLPDAIATSLSRYGSLTVRSTALGARFAGPAPDLRSIAAEADVDRVVIGTLLRSGRDLRVSVQLIDAPTGTLIVSHTVQASVQDLFGLQDELARCVVSALSAPLVEAPSSRADAPRDPRAYELYLRATDLARQHDSVVRARSLYERCLELDPDFAPAWAHLGRCHRVIGKFIDGTTDSVARAEAALMRALDLSPQLTIAHKYLAHLEADSGQATQALSRLLGQARRHPNDAELLAGLVHACRYCGLNEASLAAHAEARRVDPNVSTSVEETLLITGNVERLLEQRPALLRPATEDATRVIGLGLAGRREEARGLLQGLQATSANTVEGWCRYLSAWLDRRPEDMVLDTSASGPLVVHEDPEAVFQEGWLLCDAGGYERGLERLGEAVRRGYFPEQTLSSSRHFDPIRGTSGFEAVLTTARRGRERALAAFRDAGGDELLGTGTRS